VPALDGLRGLALLGVLAFHAGRLEGGWLGVDLFFVLSGFLITRLLVAENEASGTIDLRAFWIRRARRLLPALFVMMPAIAAYARWVAPPEDVERIRHDAIATLAYVANWRRIHSGESYWDLFAAPSPLEHTWSLAIEEQFYVVWPLVVLLALRFIGRRGLTALTALLALASAAAMFALFEPAASSRVYFGTDTRATGLLAGACFGIVVTDARMNTLLGRSPLRAGLAILGVVSAVGLAAAWWLLDGQHPFVYRGGIWLTEVGALALLGCALAGSRNVVGRLLAARPLRWLGTLSYGAYLWHWPIALVLTTDRVGVGGLALDAVRLLSTLAIAAASYQLVEKPIRERAWTSGRAVLSSGAGLAAAAAVVLLGTVPRPSSAKLALLADPGPDLAAMAGELRDRIRISVHGDSTANSIGWALRGLRDPRLYVRLEGDDGFSVVSHELPTWNEKEAEARIVVLGGAFLYGIRVKGKWTKACHPEWNRRFEENFERWLEAAGDRAERLWVATVPYPVGRYDTEEDRAKVDCINQSIRTVVAKRPALRVLELAELLCPRGVCPRESEGEVIRPDGVHYDIEGSRVLAAAILGEIERGLPARERH
jgi:peptidoglycan/LPS O-acetylase OafA/YrhL